MRLKEEVLKSVEEMAPDELKVLYEQIRLLKDRRSCRTRDMIPIEVVQEALSTSRGDWSQEVTADREDRL